MEVYIHIGYHKTGTTSIQKFLSLNRRALNKESVCYIGGFENHYMYSVLYHSRENYDSGVSKESLATKDSFFRELEQKRYDKILLSSEGFLESNAVPGLLAEDIKPFLGRGVVVKVVVYLRRQDDWLQSAYQQRVKQANCRLPETLSESLAGSLPFVDYAKKLQFWENAFGRENMIVRIFEPDSLKGDIFQDFSEAVGFQIDDSFQYPQKSQSNIGIDFDVLEMMRISNRLGLSAALHEELLRVSESMDSSHQVSASLLSVAERAEIIEWYAESNAQVASKYFGRTDGVLFSNSGFDSVHDKKHSLTVEGAVGVLLKIIDKKFN